MTDPTAQARAIVDTFQMAVRHHPYTVFEGDDSGLLVTAIAAALVAVEQGVWEEAAAYLDAEAKRFDHVDDGEAHMIRAFAAWCLAQAQQAQGREHEIT